jgi:hypothetical protein
MSNLKRYYNSQIWNINKCLYLWKSYLWNPDNNFELMMNKLKMVVIIMNNGCLKHPHNGLAY